MENIFVVHGLNQTDGDSVVAAVIESDYKKHELVKIIKNMCDTMVNKLNDPKIKVRTFISIDEDDLG